MAGFETIPDDWLRSFTGLNASSIRGGGRDSPSLPAMQDRRDRSQLAYGYGGPAEKIYKTPVPRLPGNVDLVLPRRQAAARVLDLQSRGFHLPGGPSKMTDRRTDMVVIELRPYV